MNAVAEKKNEQTAVAPVQAAPVANPVMEMIKQAVAAGQPLDVIRELKDMAKELAADEAQRAFNVAFAAFKSEAVEVFRNREVTDGPLKGRKYAELHSFVDAAAPALAKHGLSHSWSVTRDERDWIEVTCTIEHIDGGKKQTSQGGPPDAGGAKNSLQARISTVTYLERVTFKAACGLAEKGDDDDGAGGDSGALISMEQLEQLQALLTETQSDVAKFCQVMKVDSLAGIPAKRFPDAIAKLNAKKARAAQ